MAEIYVKNNGGNRFGGVPYGNLAAEHYRIVAKQDGAILGGMLLSRLRRAMCWRWVSWNRVSVWMTRRLL